MKTWNHPTGNSPKSVNLLCLGNSKQSYIAGAMEPDLADFTFGADETWTLNRGFSVFNHDLCFIMDNIQGEADKFPRYGAALWKHNKPIITSDNCDRWPAHVHRFPIYEVFEWLREEVKPMHGDWFHNSVAYILVYAAFIGVKQVNVFGADYSNHSSGVVEDGHPCVAYWAGKLECTGLTVRVVADSAFLNANQRHWMYGYREHPLAVPASRRAFEDMISKENRFENKGDLLSGERQVAQTIDGIRLDHVNRYKFAAAKVSGIVADLGAGIGYGSSILADAQGVDAVYSIDISNDALEYSATFYDRENVIRVNRDLDKDAIDMGCDWAVAFEVIEHLKNPEALLKSLNCPKILVSVPNENVLRFNADTMPFHHRHYTASELTELLENSGFEVDWLYGQDGEEGKVERFNHMCHRTIIAAATRRAGLG